MALDQNLAKKYFPSNGDALLIVDVQNDFLPGGSLAVKEGEKIIPPLNKLISIFSQLNLPIYASRDWHPKNHCSFQEQGGPWPAHCIAETEGSQFAPGLNIPDNTIIISKAQTQEEDAYSAFQNTSLKNNLLEKNIKRVFICGLATDYCVLNTVKDALQHKFSVVLLKDAIQAVNVNPGDGPQALSEMESLGTNCITTHILKPLFRSTSPLLTDLYQLTMLKAYHDEGMTDEAVFEFFIRNLPAQRNFFVVAGLEQVLEYLETLCFTDQDIFWLTQTKLFSEEFIQSLRTFRFSGHVDALPEGTICFPNEPIIRITAPIQEAQLIETHIINILQYQTLIATKAARIVLSAPEKSLIDFGLRRAHSLEAGLLASRASYLAGFAGTAAVAANVEFGIPVFGTMAHSYILSQDDEHQAFRNFINSWPQNAILLLDTYDTEKAVNKVVLLYNELKKKNIFIKGVRIDSGDLALLSNKVRSIFDKAGLQEVKIFVSGKLDEYEIERLISKGAAIDGFGIGTQLVVSSDCPSLDCAYKLQEYQGKPRRKLSQNKSTLPGRKQIIRIWDQDGKIKEDRLVLDNEISQETPLLKPYLRLGRRLSPPLSLDQIRLYAKKQMDQLPDDLRSLNSQSIYPVHISKKLIELANQCL